VFGSVNSQTVATPAVVVVVPDTTFANQPIRVHLDTIQQTILGYSVRTWDVNYGVEGQSVFVPGISQGVGTVYATLPAVPVDSKVNCVNFGVTTPAVPVYIPGSALTVPAAATNTPNIQMTILGHPVTAPGQVISAGGQTVVIPNMAQAVPGVPVGTPNQSIVVNINGTVQQAEYIAPPGV
jgi:hypothetical protein